MAKTSAPPTGPSGPSGPRTILGVGAVTGLLGFAVSVSALIIATGGGGSDEVIATAVPGTAHVSLTEFAIDPGTIEIAAGGTLHVVNEGSVEHNLAVEDTALLTPNIQAGGTEELAIGDLAPGQYTVVCVIPGHADAGMRGEVTVVAAADGVAAAPTETTAGHAGHEEMDYAAMTQAMIDSMAAFPAATEGLGNAPLEPTEVLADGTLVFDLVAAITPWERAPGDIVDAWTYNGTVPAPTIHLEIGDHAQFRLRNDLPIATDLHLHGLNVDNEFDGVAPITQDPIAPGETFTYEYTADEVAVAMYHPHFHSQMGMPNGMFGTILVGQVPIPRGTTVGDEVIPADLVVAQEFPMVLNDSGVIGLSLNGKSFPATAPIVANTGDWVLFHYFNEGSQTHPMHLHSFDQIVLARDGFPLDQPYVADVINVAPGERYSVLVQFDEPGTWVWHCHILPHVEDANGMFGMVTAVVVQ
jgi:uncharacterized cupredoxin-like copper-binding protein